MPKPAPDPHQFPHDSALPQLKTASDPDLMAEIFRRSLRPRAGRTYDITHCRISRVSYLRGDRCVLQYTLRLVDLQRGQESNQWVVGAIDTGDRAYRNWRKLEAIGAGREIPQAGQRFEPFSYIPEMKMLVQVFPFDRGLPTLPLLMEGPPPALGAVILGGLGAGSWHAETWTSEPLEYGPGAGAVLRCTVRARDTVLDTTVQRRFYLKIYGDERGAKAHRVLEALCRAADADAQGFGFCRPLAYLEDLATLVLEDAPGTSLRQAVLRGRGMATAVRTAARALAALHLGGVPEERYTLEEEFSHMQEMGVRIQMACPHLTAEIAEVVDALAAGLPEMPPCPTHRNMKLDHILLDGGRVVFIDLDSFAGTDPVLDPAALLAQLAAMSSLSPLPQRRVRMAAQVFVEEYFARVPQAWRGRLPVHYAGALLVNAYGLFRFQTPGWSTKIAALVEEARQSLVGRVW